jgi:hypothetical protein
MTEALTEPYPKNMDHKPSSPSVSFLEFNTKLERLPSSLQKKEESTSNSQTVNDTSLEISPNNSSILEHLFEMKKLFKMQEEEMSKYKETNAILDTGSKRLQEIIETANKESFESILYSTHMLPSSFIYDEASVPVISPVPGDYEDSGFASSLMSFSRDSLKAINYTSEPFLSFIKFKLKPTSFKQKAMFRSHIIGIRI